MEFLDVGSPIDTGDTAWMLAATALVLFMSMPGLALYYSGMVSAKNVLSTTMQVFSICCIVTIEWFMFGYSFSFAPATTREPQSSGIYGDCSRLWLRGLQVNSIHMLAPTIPEALFCAYQLTFAIITAALICGSFAERMKYESMAVFIALWHVSVYCPIAHAVWHPDGFLFRLGALDYAGGNVVHIASGTAGLMTAYVIGCRKNWVAGSNESHPPHNIIMTYMGMSMLWVGWFGFNAGSAYGATTRAAYALLVTQIATATSALTWMMTESIFRKKPSVLGMINGAVAGLVCITPASGYVDMNGAFWIGLIGGPLCYAGSQFKHYILMLDDSLDAFGVHAVGGIVGGLATGFFATAEVTGLATQNGVFTAGVDQGGHQLAYQIAAICFSLGWSASVTFVLLIAVDTVMGLRVTSDEDAGLDESLHDECVRISMPIPMPMPILSTSPAHNKIALKSPPSKDECEFSVPPEEIFEFSSFKARPGISSKDGVPDLTGPPPGPTEPLPSRNGIDPYAASSAEKGVHSQKQEGNSRPLPAASSESPTCAPLQKIETSEERKEECGGRDRAGEVTSTQDEKEGHPPAAGYCNPNSC